MRKIVLMILVGLVAVVGGTWYLATATPIPSPDEALRVRHLAGFSIVGPAGWLPTTGSGDGKTTPDYITFVPEKIASKRPEFSVKRLPTVMSAQAYQQRQYRPSQFQDRPAFVFQDIVQRQFVYSIAFERNGEWFEITLSLAGRQQIPGSTWEKYFETFRLEKQAMTPASGTRLSQACHPAPALAAP